LPPEAIEKLAALLERAGAKVTLDLGRNMLHNCTFCNEPPAASHELCDIGHYMNGETITRPVCVSCKVLIPEERVTPIHELVEAEIAKALRLAKGSPVRASRMLKIGRATMYRRITAYKKRVAA
jgi:DNA-binding NtrC family response regulator